ncbi:LuxR C-terminal-related transcriptional regulator [Chloroflexota bacterium]
MVDEAEDTTQLSPEVEEVIIQRARDRAVAGKWDLNIAIFLFAVLILVIILAIYTRIGIEIVAPVAIIGLTMVWLVGWRREQQLYQRFYIEELSTLEQKAEKEASTFTAPLTPRELETLNYVAQGYSNKQIAIELGISEDTIKTHVARILTKLNANDRTEAAVIAIKKGLISAE